MTPFGIHVLGIHAFLALVTGISQLPLSFTHANAEIRMSSTLTLADSTMDTVEPQHKSHPHAAIRG